MTTIFVQFSDTTDTQIVSAFSCQQDPAIYPNQGSVSASDARWKTFYDALPANARATFPSPAS